MPQGVRVRVSPPAQIHFHLMIVQEFTCKEIKILNDNPKSKLKIVAIDYGVKQNILNCLHNLNANIVVVPATTPASVILSYKPDGVFLSNGPGDPHATSKNIYRPNKIK